MLPVSAVVPILITSDKSGAGKDFTANYIRNYFEVILVQNRVKTEVTKLHIAEGMKEMAADLFGYLGVRSSYFYEAFRKSRNQVLKGVDSNVVDLWVALGNFARGIHEDVWIEALIREIEKEQAKLKPKEFPSHEEPFGRVFLVCIPDWRFDRERERLVHKYPTTITITVKSNVEVEEHTFDGGLTFKEFDWSLINDKTEQYKVDLLHLCQEIHTRVQALAPKVGI